MNFSSPLPQAAWLSRLAKFALTFFALSGAAAIAQPATGDPTLAAAARAMGARGLDTIIFKANGTNGTFGQAFQPGGPWPTFKVVSYTQAMNYANGSMRVDIERTNPDGPLQGSGLPLLPPLPQKMPAAILAPGGANAALALQLWMTPHGVIKAAQKGAFTVSGRTISFRSGTTHVKATLSADNLISRAEALIDNPMTGDTRIEWEYTEYKDFGGVAFPMHIVQKQGGLPILDLKVTDVTLNAEVKIEAPAAGGAAPAAAAAAPTVTLTKVADGVHYVTGGSHHSLIVEFSDHVVLFEVPQNDARALAVIAATRKQFPNKPIRYVVNSHHHFDHAGGIRAAMAEGLTILTQAQNKSYYEKIAAMPHTLNPDQLAKTPKAPKIETVDTKRVLSDSTMTLELYKIATSHADTLLVGYLPKSKQLFEVDVFTTAGDAPATAKPATVSPVTAGFYDEIIKLKLDVAEILPGHGPRKTTLAELKVVAGK
jgi:glyoxylase-like metal-dependent hydrolase (beta-lactamase superfamily II)